MSSVNDINNILGRSVVATPQTPSQIQGQGSASFTPSVNDINSILGRQVTAPQQPQTQQPSIEQQQRVIQGGIQQAEQGTFAPETRLGIFTAPDVLARKIASGEIKETEKRILDEANTQIELISRLIEETDDPTIKQRRTENLTRYIEDTNNLLQEQIFQLPSNLQVGAALAETALDIAPVPAFRLLRGAKIGTRLATEATEQGVKILEKGAIRAPVTAGRAALNQSIFGGTLGGAGATLAGIQETGDIKEGLKQGAIGAPLGAGLGVALPLTGRALQPLREAILRPQEIKNKPLRWIMQKVGSPIKNVVGSTGASGANLRNLTEEARDAGVSLQGRVLTGKDKFLPIYNQLNDVEKKDWFNIVAKEANFGLSPEEVIAKENIVDPRMQNAVRSFFDDITKPLSEIASKTGTEYRGGAIIIEEGRQAREIVRRAGKPGVFMPRIFTEEARKELTELGKDKAIKKIADTDSRISKILDEDERLIAARKKFDALTPDDQRLLTAARARVATLNSIDDYAKGNFETDVTKIIDTMIDRDAMSLGLQSIITDTSNPIVRATLNKLQTKGVPTMKLAGTDKIKLPSGDISYNALEDILVSDFGVARTRARTIVNNATDKAGIKTLKGESELLVKNKKIVEEILNREVKLTKGVIKPSTLSASQEEIFNQLPAHKKVNTILQQLYDEVGQETAKKFGEGEREIIDKMARDYVNKQFFSLPFDESGLVSMAKQLQAAKLSTSFVANSTQLLATLMTTDLPTLGKAFLKTFTTIDGKKLVKKSGIIQDSVLKREMGGKFFKGYQKFLDVWLAPFKWTENNLNRAVTGNAGAMYATKLFKIGKTDELSKILSKKKITEALKRGYLSEEDLMSSARGLVNKTQFGWNAAEYPQLWSTPWGSVLFQFKSFIYRQMLLLLDETAGEFAAGRAGKAQKNMVLILAMYPAAGHVIKSFNNFIAGKPTDIDEISIARYFEDVASSGGFGMGVEFLESVQDRRGLEFLIGPTFGTPIPVLESTIKQGLDPGGQVENIIRQTSGQFGGAGRFLGRQLIEGIQ